jgi:photosystem II stability/assembly factor-like uncharacterized protein
MKFLLLVLLPLYSLLALNYHGCTLAPDNLHGWVVCIDTVLILHTTDGGATWQPQLNVPSNAKRFFDVACIDKDRVWTCGILGDILHTECGGLLWYRQADGLSKYATRIEFFDDTYGWATCGDGTVGRTTDGGGKKLNELHMGIRTKKSGAWNDPVDLKWYPYMIDATCWDSVSLDTSVNTADSIKIYFYYDDLGTEAFYTGIDNIEVFAIPSYGEHNMRQSWDFETGWQGWTHTNGQSFPQAWDVQPWSIHNPPPNAGDSCLWIDSQAAGFGVIVQDTAWSPMFAPVPGSVQWVKWAISIYGEGGFWEQNFVTWLDAEFYGVSFVNQSDGWIVAGFPDSMLTGQGYILRSNDGGVNWDSLYKSSTYEDFFDVHFFHLLNGIVVGGDEADLSPIILKSTSGGSSWNSVSTSANSYYLRALDFVGNEGWAVGRFGTIIHTTDAGDTWTFQDNPATTTLFDVDFSDNLHGIACGQDIILYTTDGGQTWHPTGIKEYQPAKTQVVNLQVSPNPCVNGIKIKLSVSQGVNNMELKIYDVTGRVVKDFSRPTHYSATQYGGLLPTVISWDGTDDDGNDVAQGIYFVELKTSVQTITEKVVLLK